MAETSKAKQRRIREGFFDRYIHGKGIDIGCGRLQTHDGADPLTDSVVQHDSDICDAHTMNVYKDEEFDYVYASHILEHLDYPKVAVRNWYRILKYGGHLIIAVPSAFRYEKQLKLPSRWNGDHKLLYYPSTLLSIVEASLQPNSYLIEYFKDCAEGYDWSIPPNMHSCGEYQYECVIKKIKAPTWEL